ncbi:hypothetical protein QP635_05555 [Staphylococcus hominis]|uniref:hypothetical protein n=1 Tax=Staphylococcus hominis TaxID=1290 RepID=UPI0008A25EE8|nr:hypothetical protein [Staphylococcus hominis]MDK7929367.1 hypothetical protein [Staphylococcus hominis]
MKRFLALIFSSALILGACGNNDTSNNDSDTKSESKTEKKSEDKKDNKSKEDKKSKEEKKSQENEDNKSTQENNSTEEQNTQENATDEQVQSQQAQQSDNHEATKEEIYEWDKQNVPGGTDYGLIDPEDVNDANSQTEQKYDYDNNGVYRTPEEQKAHEDWVNGQIEWNKQQEAKEQKLQDEYFDLSDKMYEDGVSESEYNSMEKRQEEILDEVEPIN